MRRSVNRTPHFCRANVTGMTIVAPPPSGGLKVALWTRRNDAAHHFVSESAASAGGRREHLAVGTNLGVSPAPIPGDRDCSRDPCCSKRGSPPAFPRRRVGVGDRSAADFGASDVGVALRPFDFSPPVPAPPGVPAVVAPMPPRPAPSHAGANDATAAATEIEPAGTACRNAGPRLRGLIERAGGHVAPFENAGGRRPLSIESTEGRHLELIELRARVARARPCSSNRSWPRALAPPVPLWGLRRSAAAVDVAVAVAVGSGRVFDGGRRRKRLHRVDETCDVELVVDDRDPSSRSR